MNLLLATLGGSWQVVPEVYGFTTLEDLSLYVESSLARESEAATFEMAAAGTGRSGPEAVERKGDGVEGWLAHGVVVLEGGNESPVDIMQCVGLQGL